jgi:peptide/nickel transport system ATP-binding protein
VVGHMCEGLAVMQHGAVVETMTVARLRDNTPTHPYTKRLLRASLGYDRSALESLEEETP